MCRDPGPGRRASRGSRSPRRRARRERPSAAVLAACAIAGVDEVYAIGGAQAIAALAFGTESVAPVDVIAGPGNRYVTEAKRQVAGRVGIDGLAGPSELMVVADGGADPELDRARPLRPGRARRRQPAGGRSRPTRRCSTASPSWSRSSPPSAPASPTAPLALVAAPGLELALGARRRLSRPSTWSSPSRAPTRRPRARGSPGCVFVGAGGATAFGDYVAGSNHVLPTGGAARFGGPLGPGAFMRRTSVVSIRAAAAAALAPARRGDRRAPRDSRCTASRPSRATDADG